MKANYLRGIASIGNGKSWCEHLRLRQVEVRIKVVSKVKKERI